MIFGVGVYKAGKYLSRVDGKLTRGYAVWKHMIERCYYDKYSEKYPTYRGCTVEEDFKNFQTFMLWAEKQIGFSCRDFVLDKDLLQKGNKQYNKDLCVFIPVELNAILTNSKATRGKLPVGVSLNSSKYMATLCIDGKNKNLGRFNTPEEAFSAYKDAKESNIRRVAEKYKDLIDPRAYATLMCYDVDIND